MPLRLHLLLLRFDLLKLGLEFILLRPDYLMLLLQLVEQHGSKHLILHRVGLAIFVVHHHLGIYLGHFLGDQSVLQQVRSIVVLRLVQEAHRAQLEQLIGIIPHVGDLLLEATRGEDAICPWSYAPELSETVDANRLDGTLGSRCRTVDARDVSIRLNAQRPDEDLVADGGLVGLSRITELDVVVGTVLVVAGSGPHANIVASVESYVGTAAGSRA